MYPRSGKVRVVVPNVSIGYDRKDEIGDSPEWVGCRPETPEGRPD